MASNSDAQGQGPRDDGQPKQLNRYDGILDRAIREASKLAGAAVEQLRAQYPNADDSTIIGKLEALFSTTVTTTGVATGGAAAIPGVGTLAALATGVGDGTFFLTASASHVLAVAHVYGIRVDHYERQRALLLMVLAGGGMAGGVSKAAGRTGSHLGAKAVQAAPMEGIRQMNRILGRNFVTKYGTRQGIVVLGRAAPFGIGAVIGGGGNYIMARGVIKATRKAFETALGEAISGSTDVAEDLLAGQAAAEDGSGQRIRDVEPTQVKLIAGACERDLGDPALWFEPGGYPDSLALCIIDSIYSTGAHYSSVLNVVKRYCTYRSEQGGDAYTDGLDELRNSFEELGGPDSWASQIGNRRPVSTAKGAPLKAEAIAHVIKSFEALGIKSADDLRAARDGGGNSAAKKAWLSAPGQKSGITWEYALMLAGVPRVKADRMVIRFVSRAIGREASQVSPTEAALWVEQVAALRAWDVRHLDHVIWRYESGRPFHRDDSPKETTDPDPNPEV